MKVGFVGLTHLGITTSICWAEKFGNVIGFDTNVDVVEKLNSYDPVIDEPMLKEFLAKNRFFIEFTCDFERIKECGVVFFVHDIATDENNKSDYSGFYEYVDMVVPHLVQGVKIVIMSQVRVGMCREVVAHIKKVRPDLDFELLYMVETLVIGDAAKRFLEPERLVLGTEHGYVHDSELFQMLHRFNAPIFEMKYESSEICKEAINFYLYNSVVFANTLSDICEKVGADMNEIIPALRSDKRIGKYAYIQPGLGVAGGNLERDMESLKGLDESRFVSQLVWLNERRYKWLIRKLEEKDGLSRIAICGVAYKKGVASVKNSPVMRFIDDAKGYLNIRVYDPLIRIDDSKVLVADNMYDATWGADCLVIGNDSDEFKDVDLKRLKINMSGCLIVDCTGTLLKREKELKELGFEYTVMGRGI